MDSSSLDPTRTWWSDIVTQRGLVPKQIEPGLQAPLPRQAHKLPKKVDRHTTGVLCLTVMVLIVPAFLVAGSIDALLLYGGIMSLIVLATTVILFLSSASASVAR